MEASQCPEVDCEPSPKKARTDPASTHCSEFTPSTSSRRRSSGASTSNKTPRVTESDVKRVLKAIKGNKEPYCQSDWRREPWDVRNYDQLYSYQVADDAGEELDKKILRRGLSTTAKSSAENGVDGDPDAGMGMCLHLDKLKQALQLGVDVEERYSWGIDCFTRRVLFDALGSCRELTARAPEEDMDAAVTRTDFIEQKILPSLNSLGANGWDVFEAVRKLEVDAMEEGDDVTVLTASRLQQIMLYVERAHAENKGVASGRKALPPTERIFFRAHPKGQGIFCIRPGGLPSDTFVAEYLGELYPPWRWFERQDVIKKRCLTSSLPDFYNIQLERPKEDDLGYGVMFVEGADKGNFASRLCHSCRPNCRTLSVCADGQISNAVFTSRDVREGEELCWDYACVTESEKEYRAAICLCGTGGCRGSFLFYANSSSFQEVISRDHNFLDRTAILLRASSESPTTEDVQRLERHGIKLHVLQLKDNCDEMIPDWLIKWAALILEFIERESRELPAALVKKSIGNPELQLNYDEQTAQIEANGVLANRLQNLVITLDKAKYFLRKQPKGMQKPPLRLLTPEEILRHLWYSDESVARKTVEVLEDYYRKQCNGKSEDGSKSTRHCNDSRLISDVRGMLNNYEPATPDAARQGLLKIAHIVRAAGQEHAALHDILILKGNTRTMFTVNKYQGVTSSPVRLSKTDAPTPAKVSHNEEGGSISGKGTKRGRAKNVEAKKYSSEFLWGQLVAWYKQTIYNPAASLSADRRGTLSLPVLDCCYTSAVLDGTFMLKQRGPMIAMIETKPDTLWPTGTIWSFRNNAKIYGTPMMDNALRKCRNQGNDGLMQRLVVELRQAFCQSQSESENTPNKVEGGPLSNGKQ